MSGKKAPQGHRARKRFGQNFLHDMGVIDRIVRSIAPRPRDHIVEIGPGMGALTESLLEGTDGHLDVVELDRDLIPILRTKFFNYPGFRIHESDALKFDFSNLYPDEPIRVVGNLPYNISTPLIFHLLEQSAPIRDMHFMLQKEVVQRLGAQPGEKHYGRLGIMAQYHCQVMPLFEVGPGAFRPAPKVDSAIVRLIPYSNKPHPAKDIRLLQRVVTTAFTMRRKTLRNALKQLLDEAAMQTLDIDPSRRPETLSLAEYVRISDYLSEAGSD